jgi:hypothetical protein
MPERRPNRLSGGATLSKDNFSTDLSTEDLLDLLRPGDPSSVPEHLWEEWKRDELEADDIEDRHRLAQDEELLDSLEDEPELRERIEARIAEIEDRSSRQVSLKYRSKLKQQILLALMEKADMRDRQVCEWLDRYWENELPYGKPFVKAYEGGERSRLESIICKVRRDLRRLRRPLP